MRDRVACVSIVVLALAGVAACGDDQDPEGAQELWDRIHAADYRSWARAPGYESRVASNAPHGDMVDIYVNDVIADALAAGKPLGAWPEGAQIVKDGWDGEELELVAAMEKGAHGWFWAEYDGEGDPSYSGKPDLCTDCHRSGSDYVRAFALPN